MKVEKLLKNICKYSGSIKYGTDEETFTKKAMRCAISLFTNIQKQ